MADWQAGEPCHPGDDLLFFVANFAAIALELMVVPRLKSRVKRYCADEKVARLAGSGWVEVVVGYVWVLAFFFWITPKWQYPKLHAVLIQAELDSGVI